MYCSWSEHDLFCHVGCPDMTTLNAEKPGVITSPYYPRSYPKYQRCGWQITASKGKRVKLVVNPENSMRLGKCRRWGSYLCDYLEIQDGSSSANGTQCDRISHLSGSVTYYSFHESLKVLFVSGDGVQDRYSNISGFKATYTQVNYTAPTGE